MNAEPASTSATAPRPSLRRQLTFVFCGLALLIAAAQALLVYGAGYSAEETLIDRIVAEQLTMSMAAFKRDPSQAQPNTPDMRLYVADEGDNAPLPDFLRQLPRRPGSYEVFPGAGVEYHIAVSLDQGRWFYLVYDVAEHEERQHRVAMVLAASVLAIGLLVLVLSHYLARRLTADLERLAGAVRPAAAGQQLVTLAHHEESWRLAAALDDYRARLDEALRRERVFSAAASHELRTPLMRISSALDLLRSQPLDERTQHLLRQIADSQTEMAMLTGGLLRVARGTTQSHAAPTALAELVDEVLAHLTQEAQARSIELHHALDAATRVNGDRAALWIVLTNVIRNAIRHSGAARIDIDWRDGALQVSDNGRGFDPRRAAADRQAAGADSRGDLGLGLTIIERICAAAGWPLAVDSEPGRGTTVSITLNPHAFHAQASLDA